MKWKNVRKWSFAIGMSILIAGFTVGCGKDEESQPISTKTSVLSEAEPEEPVELTREDLEGLIEGLSDRNVLLGAENVDWLKGVKLDATVVQAIKVDESKVDLISSGSYEMTYTVLVNEELVRDYISGGYLPELTDVSEDFVTTSETAEKSDDIVEILVPCQVFVLTENQAEQKVKDGEVVLISDKALFEVKEEAEEEEETESEEEEQKEEKKDSSKKQQSSDSGQSSGSNHNSASNSSGSSNQNTGSNQNSDLHNGDNNEQDSGSNGSNSSDNSGGTDNSGSSTHTHSWTHVDGSGHTEIWSIDDGYGNVTQQEVWVQDSPGYDVCSGCGATR